ncbi:NAD(P)-dependent oxidoreductase [Pseudorhodoferax sp. Leaf274]|uniref:NAD(P)-dependent oxidoreductase n=1 Tax=Pseudorhodoferax sp. Leaf274 TaxID=1736318 RepID=UPI00070246A7|nr:NAD(P)H-binding protein [Pseudorhodoferax sp. Leaf274]KQP37330.1 3-beta hydroxysteroid dehydrogenase [Pseudorhodoferax sp. Leaf274]
MTQVAILGITGNAGSRIANELLARGHSVTGIARDPSKAVPRPGLTTVAADATQLAALVPLIQGHDVVVSSTRFAGGIDAATLLAAARQAGVPRVVVVGGAGSLEVAPGVALIDTPQFPDAYKAEAGAGRVFLQALRAEQGIDWTFVSPSAVFAPGERTGTFRLGGDALLVDAQGNSHISMEDFAIALADEIERPRHARQRFTVGY